MSSNGTYFIIILMNSVFVLDWFNEQTPSVDTENRERETEELKLKLKTLNYPKK